MTFSGKTALVACAAAAFALSVTACGSSTTSEGGSSASSAVSSATEPSGEAEGSLASVCGEIDTIMMGEPDADPAGTAAKLEEIKAKVSTHDADLIEHLAEAYKAIAETPHDPAVQEELKSSSTALGTSCHATTSTAKPN